MAVKRFGAPIQRASRDRRTYEGHVYASLEEMYYAIHLDVLVNVGEVFRWMAQPMFRLGEDITYKPDFIVTKHCTLKYRTLCQGRSIREISYEDTYVVDVKGYAQTGWTKKRKLWLKYGTVPLLVVQRKRGSWHTIDVVDPADPQPLKRKT